MIYNYLKGGLGNMLFQIAATKSISVDTGCNCSFPNLDSQLNLINLDSTYNEKIKHALEYKTIFKNLDSTKPTSNVPIQYYPFHYVKPQLVDNIIVDGFFQSEKYFVHNRQKILEFLNFEEISKLVYEKYGSLLKSKTTAIHVRRGDYLKFPNHHPTQTIEYFETAIKMIEDKTDKFLIFSDDIEWCKKEFKVYNVIYIENEKDYIELYLMSLCNNVIISNSSFSWWGAWLNQNENKIVISPSKWFGNSINHNTDDIIPNSWIKI
jgi:hypothetical protein